MQSASPGGGNFMPTTVDYRAGRYKPGLVRLFLVGLQEGENNRTKFVDPSKHLVSNCFFSIVIILTKPLRGAPSAAFDFIPTGGVSLGRSSNLAPFLMKGP